MHASQRFVIRIPVPAELQQARWAAVRSRRTDASHTDAERPGEADGVGSADGGRLQLVLRRMHDANGAERGWSVDARAAGSSRRSARQLKGAKHRDGNGSEEVDDEVDELEERHGAVVDDDDDYDGGGDDDEEEGESAGGRSTIRSRKRRRRH